MGIAAGRGGRKPARGVPRRIEESDRQRIHLTVDRRNTLRCSIDKFEWCYLALAQQRHRLGCGETNEFVTRSHDGPSGQRVAKEPLKSFLLHKRTFASVKRTKGLIAGQGSNHFEPTFPR